ncbi:MAG: CoA transferase, partial [Acidimicrobiia bacterium]|nr:CoA transferase [Acidimicrobiia bacterium]
GPYAAMFLADNGADVVKLETPEGDPYRADPGFQTIARNKRSIVLPGGTAGENQRRALAAAADLIIVDRPGQAAEVRRLNAGAVIVACPPWGEQGPKRDDPWSSALLHAATGIAWNQQSYAEVPVDLVVPIVGYGTGVLAALAAAAGLLVRAQRGAAPTYEVSQVAGAAALQLGESRPAGPPAERPGDSGLGSKGRVACYRLVEAGDGKWFFLACGTARFYHRMLEVIGRPDLADDPVLANPPWGLMFDEPIARLTPILDEVFATRPRDHWLAALAEADVPAQPVLTRAEFLRHSIVVANAMDVTAEHPELGPVGMMGLPVTLASAPGSIRRPAPLLDQHHHEILADWLPASDPVPPTATGEAPGHQSAAAPPDPTRPLAGVRVIDLASFIAGPVISRHLAMLGAEVIKIEAPAGDPFRSIGPPFESWNQGKRSIICDLTTPAGQAVLHRLAAGADIVIENFRPGVAARLGADRERLAAINPRLIFLSSPGYGLDPDMAERPAFDPLVQALGGFMAAQGGIEGPDGEAVPGREPVFLSVAVHDVVTPMIGAFGLAMALFERHRTGEAQMVRTSLAQSTMAMQAAEYTRYAGRPPTAGGGFDHPGPDDEHRWYEADGGGYVWRDGELEVPVCTVGLSGSELAEANDLCVTYDHPRLGPVVMFGQLIGGAGPAPERAPLLGEHSDEIRAEIDAGRWSANSGDL